MNTVFAVRRVCQIWLLRVVVVRVVVGWVADNRLVVTVVAAAPAGEEVVEEEAIGIVEIKCQGIIVEEEEEEEQEGEVETWVVPMTGKEVSVVLFVWGFTSIVLSYWLLKFSPPKYYVLSKIYRQSTASS
jgi:hypothetical protein